MTTQLPSREDVNNALFRLTTPLRGIIEKDSTALMDKVALEKIAAHLTQITNAYCALLAAHEQEPVGHVIQQLRGYENPTYVVQMANEPEDGDEVFSHPAPVHAVPEGYVLVPLKPTKDMLTAAEYDRGADWQYSVDI